MNKRGRTPARDGSKSGSALASVLVLVFASAFVFAACAGGPAPVDHFYRIEVGKPSSTGGFALSGPIHVNPLRTDGLIGQRRMLYRQNEATAEIAQHAYHRWADPPAIALQTALVGFLRDAGAAEIVMEANARSRPDYTISGRIHRLERILGGEPAVVVELELTMMSSKGELLVHESYRETRAAADVAEAARAIGDAVHGIFERFLVDLHQ